MSWVAGFDLGGTQIKAIAVERSTGKVMDRNLHPTRAGEMSDGLHAWAHAVRIQLGIWETRFGEAGGVGVSAPGLAASDGRSIAFMPGRMQGLENFDWGAFLRRPSVPVLNDAHAAMLGEAWLGAAAGLRHAVMLTLGTGVGGAIWSDGRLLAGFRQRAGHLGHISLNPSGSPDICGTPGSLEDAIGEASLSARSGGRFQSTRELLASANAGDQHAREVWETSVRALAAAIASLINLLDPEAILLGGGIAEAGDDLLNPLRSHLEGMEWRPAGWTVPLIRAKLGSWAGAFGAARQAMVSST